MRKRSRKGSPRVGLVVAAVALAIVGVLIWRVVRPSVTQPRSTVTEATGSAEDFSAAERRSLEDILNRKGAGAQK